MNTQAFLPMNKQSPPHSKGARFIMLGMGEDGHTASLFPHTEGLKIEDRLVIANFIPQRQVWRMTFTYSCINQALNTVIYVLGSAKQHMLAEVLLSPHDPDRYPIQAVGTTARHALWIADEAAATELIAKKEQKK